MLGTRSGRLYVSVYLFTPGNLSLAVLRETHRTAGSDFQSSVRAIPLTTGVESSCPETGVRVKLYSAEARVLKIRVLRGACKGDRVNCWATFMCAGKKAPRVK